jgi:hypothetical protein
VLRGAGDVQRRHDADEVVASAPRPAPRYVANPRGGIATCRGGSPLAIVSRSIRFRAPDSC